MIPEEVRKEHMAICNKCKERKAVLIERRMSDMLEKLFAEYEEYRKRDKHPLPWDIWLKHKKKVRIKNDEA